MHGTLAPAVVAGFDGSPTARGAVRFAADEAVRRNRPLRIITAREGRVHGVDGQTSADLLDEAAALVRPLIGPGGVTLVDSPGPATAALLAESDVAELLVVGRGKRHSVDSVLGSVARKVVAEARCPVLVVEDSDAPHMPHTGPVVVGLDLNDVSTEALDAAFVEARLRSRELVIACAWHPERHAGPGEVLPLGLISPAVDPDVEGQVRDLAGPFLAKYPAVGLTVLCRRGSAADLLLEVGSAGSMIVVGAPRHGRLAGVFLGSVGRSVVRRAVCPVLIAHARESCTTRLEDAAAVTRSDGDRTAGLVH